MILRIIAIDIGMARKRIGIAKIGEMSLAKKINRLSPCGDVVESPRKKLAIMSTKRKIKKRRIIFVFEI